MASPFDYVSAFQQQGGGPFGSVMQGLQAGAQLSQLDAQRAQMAAQAEAARQKAEQQRVIDATLERFRTKPFSQVTVDDVAGLTGVLPAESMKVLAGMVASRSEAQNANTAVRYAQMLSAVKSGKIDVAQQLASEFAQGESDPQTKRGFEVLGQGFAAAPDAAGKQIAVMMLGLGGKYAEYATKVLGTTEAAGRNISSPADKRAAGLVDADGVPLPGTFFVEPGKEPKLITSEKPKAGFKVLTPAEARARGLPADGFTWQINESTGEVSSLAKPERGPLVTVQTPGQQPPPTEFEKAVDKKGADVYVAWRMEGGESNATARIAQLQAVVKALDKNPNLTGPQIQIIPEWARPLLVPGTVAARQNAERVIQDGLRAILGAQFTQVEGENFLKRAFDPNLKPEENSRRLRLILEQMKSSARQAKAVSDYVEKNGTLRGFKGSVPSLADFEAALGSRGREGTPAGSAAPAGVDQQIWNVMTPEERALWQRKD